MSEHGGGSVVEPRRAPEGTFEQDNVMEMFRRKDAELAAAQRRIAELTEERRLENVRAEMAEDNLKDSDDRAEAFKSDRDQYHQDYWRMMTERDEARATAERLRAALETLVQDVASHDEQGYCTAGCGTYRNHESWCAFSEARATLSEAAVTPPPGRELEL